MSEEADIDTGLMVTGNEQMNKEKRESEKGSLVEKQTKVMMTEEEIVRVVIPIKRKGKKN